MKAIVRLDVPDYQIGQEVHVYFKDSMTDKGICEQEPKTGHWIDTDEWRETVDGFEQWGYFRKCSRCRYVFKFLEIDNYCPNCGCKMLEP